MRGFRVTHFWIILKFNGFLTCWNNLFRFLGLWLTGQPHYVEQELNQKIPMKCSAWHLAQTLLCLAHHFPLTGIQLLKACQWAIPLKLREHHSTMNAKKEASEDFTNNRLKTDLHQRPLHCCNRVGTFACVCTCVGLLTYHRVLGPNSSSRLSFNAEKCILGNLCFQSLCAAERLASF